MFGKNGKILSAKVPELPEVHTISQDLNKAVSGYTISKVWLSDVYCGVANRPGFAKQLEGRKITKVTRIAKNIVIDTDSDATLLIHLGMTGRLLLIDPAKKTGKHAHLVLKLQKETAVKVLAFTDPRMFGKIQVLDSAAKSKLNEKYGIDATKAAAKIDKLFEQSAKRKTIIKTLLLDQSFISGLGNIYATESLFLSGIHPQRKANTLTKKELQKLLIAAQKVVNDGIKHRGTTLPDEAYVDIWEKPGAHQNYLNIYLKTICPKCKGKVSYTKIAQRGTYFCPKCQPL